MKNNLRQLRDGANLSQDALAKALGVSRQTISYLEASKQEPNVGLALKLARVFCCQVEDIFKLDKSEVPEMRKKVSIGAKIYRDVLLSSERKAKWAVFFDGVGIEWMYENKLHSLPSGDYRPDFFLPKLKIWVKIKPNLKRHLDKNERKQIITLCQEFALERNERVLLYDGDLINPSESLESSYLDLSIIFYPFCLHGSVSPHDVLHFDNVCWHICDRCGWVNLGNGPRAGIDYARAPINRECNICGEGILVDRGDCSSNPNLRKLYQAYERAKKYEFESVS